MNTIINTLISSVIKNENKYEQQVQEFLKTLLENEGFYAMPKVLLRINEKGDTYELERQEIYHQTCELLRMMDIEFKVLPNKAAIMIFPGAKNDSSNTAS